MVGPSRYDGPARAERAARTPLDLSLRRSARRYSSQREEFHLRWVAVLALQALRPCSSGWNRHPCQRLLGGHSRPLHEASSRNSAGQHRKAGTLAQLEERGGFDLLDALANDAEGLADLFEGLPAAVVQAKTQPEDLLFARLERAEQGIQVEPIALVGQGLIGRVGLRVRQRFGMAGASSGR